MRAVAVQSCECVQGLAAFLDQHTGVHIGAAKTGCFKRQLLTNHLRFCRLLLCACCPRLQGNMGGGFTHFLMPLVFDGIKSAGSPAFQVGCGLAAVQKVQKLEGWLLC